MRQPGRPCCTAKALDRVTAWGYGCLAIVSVPSRSGPSQESSPEYRAVSELGVIPDTVPVIVAVHMGVGSPATPAGKDIANVSAVPEIVPKSVPVLFRWQAVHVVFWSPGSLPQPVSRAIAV